LENKKRTQKRCQEPFRENLPKSVPDTFLSRSWNHANQLIAVVYKTYNNTVTKSVEYQYDALGRRIGKSVDDNGDSTMDRRETFVYDGAGLLADAAGSIHIGGPNGALNQAGWTDQLLFQFTDADADSSSFSPLATRYLYGPAVDQIFAVESASSDPLWALTDHQGTPRDWVQQTTVNGNSSTTIAQHIRYTAFGTISSVVDSTGNPIDANLAPLSSFTGQLYDAYAGLMYYRARWYDPVLGKFLNDDPMGFAAGDANVSRYVGNGTTKNTDPTGLDPTDDYHKDLFEHYQRMMQVMVLVGDELHARKKGVRNRFEQIYRNRFLT
jgi:RHS repeat-associated protein